MTDTNPQTSPETIAPAKKAAPAAVPAKGTVTSRRKLRALGRKKRAFKLRTNPEFAKTYFEARTKRAADKKVAYRKRRTKKA